MADDPAIEGAWIKQAIELEAPRCPSMSWKAN
jgi:hypothetical protein